MTKAFIANAFFFCLGISNARCWCFFGVFLYLICTAYLKPPQNRVANVPRKVTTETL